MSDREAQVTIESGDRPNEVPQEDAPNGSPFARRIFTLRNIISIFLTLVVLYLMYRELLGLDWRQAWTSLQQANAGLFALGFAVFYCSFPVRALRWKTLLANVGYELTAVPYMPSTFGLCRIMYLTWSANCITIARLGDAYRTYLLKRAVGVSFVVTLGTVVAERLLDMFVLAMMMGEALLFAFHGALPSGAAEVFAAGLIFTAVGVLGLLWMRRLRGAVERLLPKRLHSHYARLEHGVVGSFGREVPLLIVYSVLGWLIEGATLYLMVAATGTSVSVAGAILVALAASLLTVVPITPAGLGFTEAGMVILLGWAGLDIYSATAATLLFRLINYWSIVFVGFLLYVLAREASRVSSKERLEVHG